MQPKDYIPLIAPMIGFIGGLVVGFVGAVMAANNERHRQIREARIKAYGDFVSAGRDAVMWWDVVQRSSTPESRDQRNARLQVFNSAYHNARFVASASMERVLKDHRQLVDQVLKAQNPVSNSAMQKLTDAEERFYVVAGDEILGRRPRWGWLRRSKQSSHR